MASFPSASSGRGVVARSILHAAVGLSFLASAVTVRPDEKPSETVGSIEGGDIAVKGPISVDVAGGQARTVLNSGSDVRVKSGQARIELAGGGVIAICGPAHFSVLKLGGALTLALEYGTIHARIERDTALTLYTPLIQARPMAIGEAPLETTLGLQPTGAMCIRAGSGAVRIEQQLTGQSIVVPQGGSVALTGGQVESIHNDDGPCGCELALAKPAPAAKPPEWSVLSSANEVRPKSPPKRTRASAADPPNLEAPAVEEPIYKVFMPPLRFDAASPSAPPEPSPATILLVRTVRVRPTVIFRGHVDPAPAVAAVAEAPAVPQNTQTPPTATALAARNGASRNKPSMMARVRNFFRKLWNHGSCEGEGCG